MQRRLGWILMPTFHALYLSWFGDVGWTLRLRRVIDSLEEGLPLALALREELGWRLPAYFLEGLRVAETQGNLETALPLLASQMRLPAMVKWRRFWTSAPLLLEALVLVVVIGFVKTFIFPRFQEILEDQGVAWSALPQLPPGVVGLVGVAAFWYCAFGLVWVLGPWLDRSGAHLLSWVPYVSRSARRLLLLDFARSMAVLLGQRVSMPAAARLATQSARSPWLRNRVDAWVTALEAGEDWVGAWERSRLGSALEDWLVRMAAVREDPASGFALMVEWLEQEVACDVAAFERWVTPCTILMLGVLTGSFAATIISGMTAIVRSTL
jgi:type II secretory pathway component PulF